MKSQNKLLELIKEKGYKISDVANALGIDKSSLYRKINGDVQCGLSIKEANAIKNFLNLSENEANAIFFANNVA